MHLYGWSAKVIAGYLGIHRSTVRKVAFVALEAVRKLAGGSEADRV